MRRKIHYDEQCDEVVFQATIARLQEGKYEESTNWDYGEEESIVLEALNHELPHDLRELFGLEVNVRIKGTREGSLVVFFSVIISTYVLISRYKNFHESVKLIRDQANRILGRRLRSHGRYNISVGPAYPSILDEDNCRCRIHDGRSRRVRGELPIIDEDTGSEPGGYRSVSDRGLLTIVLVFALVEFVLLVALVSGAVVHTYFR
ncbi:MAG: hypothetical protein ABIE70_13905 [bacterium]